MHSRWESYFKHINLLVFSFTFLCLMIFFLLAPASLVEYIKGDYTGQIQTLYDGTYFVNAAGNFMDQHPPLTAIVYFIVTKIASLLGLNQINTYEVFSMVIVSACNVMLYHISSVFK